MKADIRLNVTRGPVTLTAGPAACWSSYTAAGAIHHQVNPGAVMLELIEVQTGAYLGEDNIVQFKDDFGQEQAQSRISLRRSSSGVTP